MFYFLSKLLTFLIQPIGILLILLLITIVIKNHTNRRRVLMFCILLTYLFSNAYLVNWIAVKYEESNVPIKIKSNYDFGVVLTGGIILNGYSNVHLGNCSDRIWQALELYRAQKINKILITGGSKNLKSTLREETIKSKLFLIKNGVPPSDIVLELNALNTFENAKFTAEYFKNTKLNPSILLISSAFHKKRAQACFLKTGLSSDFYPCSFISNPNSRFTLIDLLPTSTALRDLDLLFKEWFGYLVYYSMSYL